MTADQMDETILNILAIAKDGVSRLADLEALLAAQEGKQMDTFVVRDACWRLIDQGKADFTPLRWLKAKKRRDRQEAVKAMGPLVIKFRYRNWKGETGERRALPLRLRFAATQWHPEPQWVMEALDADKGEERSFAIKDMRMEG